MDDNKPDKYCEVCGDRAVCRNFTVMSCEPCKIFFKRFVHRYELLVCPSDGKCIINRQTRSICRKCRLNKCFAVGMRKEFILNNEVNRSKYIRKKQKQKQLNDSDTCVVSTTSEVVSSTSMFTETAVIISPVSAGRPESTQSVVELRDTITLSMDELIRQSLKTSLVYHVINDYQHWNPLEAKRLRELLTASRVLDYGLSANRIHTKCFKVLNQLCEDRTERVITDLIRFAKLIKGFADVCSEDQLALVKYGFIEVNLMQLLMSFNEETESFVFGDCANTRSIVFHLDVFKFTGVNYYDKFTRFLFMMYPLCKTDQIVCNLVIAIILFNPNRARLLNRHYIKLEQQLYIYLLQRYLSLKYGSESGTRLSILMNNLHELNTLREMQLDCTKLVKFNDVVNAFGPLAKEVYEIRIM